MARYDVLTESGSRYIIDTDLKVMRRERSTTDPDDPAVFVSILMNDYQDVPYHDLHYPLEVGSYVYATWFNGHRPVIRHSTRIVDVKEIDVPIAQDQPARERAGASAGHLRFSEARDSGPSRTGDAGSGTT